MESHLKELKQHVYVCVCVFACAHMCIHGMIRLFSLSGKQYLLLLSLSFGCFDNEERLGRERRGPDDKWF